MYLYQTVDYYLCSYFTAQENKANWLLVTKALIPGSSCGITYTWGYYPNGLRGEGFTGWLFTNSYLSYFNLNYLLRL